jgi:hypothetical protein
MCTATIGHEKGALQAPTVAFADAFRDPPSWKHAIPTVRTTRATRRIDGNHRLADPV